MRAHLLVRIPFVAWVADGKEWRDRKWRCDRETIKAMPSVTVIVLRTGLGEFLLIFTGRATIAMGAEVESSGMSSAQQQGLRGLLGS